MTPEDMFHSYDTLVLADILAIIAYYLRHRDAEVKKRQSASQQLLCNGKTVPSRGAPY